MKKRGKGRGGLAGAIGAMPVLTVLMALGAAKLMDGEILPESASPLCACIIVGVCALLCSMYCALHSAQKKFFWGMLTALIYEGILLLGNLLFFGVGYGNILSITLCALLGGAVGAMLGAIKFRKFA